MRTFQGVRGDPRKTLSGATPRYVPNSEEFRARLPSIRLDEHSSNVIALTEMAK